MRNTFHVTLRHPLDRFHTPSFPVKFEKERNGTKGKKNLWRVFVKVRKLDDDSGWSSVVRRNRRRKRLNWMSYTGDWITTLLGPRLWIFHSQEVSHRLWCIVRSPSDLLDSTQRLQVVSLDRNKVWTSRMSWHRAVFRDRRTKRDVSLWLKPTLWLLLLRRRM